MGVSYDPDSLTIARRRRTGPLARPTGDDAAVVRRRRARRVPPILEAATPLEHYVWYVERA